MTAYIDGIAAQFYRGIGPGTQYIGPFSRLNLFIGSNNAGKSIILNLISSYLPDALQGKRGASPTGPEEYRGGQTGQFAVAIGCDPEKIADNVASRRNFGPIRDQYGKEISLKAEVRSICDKLAQDGLVWITPAAPSGMQLSNQIEASQCIDWTPNWKPIWQQLTQRTGGDITSAWIPQSLERIANEARPKLRSVHLIPAKRQLGSRDEDFDDLSGKGLIDHLATLQNPKWDRQENREKFQRINMFLQEVTGKQGATLEVPSDREHLLVHMDNKVLPLSSLGTGIHEVVLISAFCTINDGSIMCIEEPEIHLHPLLQRKLISYLIENTSSQYFVATHSSAFIDTPGANVFHVSNDGVQTAIKPALTASRQRDILDDLGCQASDILQSNAIVWVEGPSDRIYVNHWISAVDSRLVEGIHYTVMFYGGGLIGHLTTSDEALGDFIKLRDLNRNMAIVIDSDRGKADDPLKSHAQRIKD